MSMESVLGSSSKLETLSFNNERSLTTPILRESFTEMKNNVSEYTDFYFISECE